MSGMASPFGKTVRGSKPRGSFVQLDPDTITLGELVDRDGDVGCDEYRAWIAARRAS